VRLEPVIGPQRFARLIGAAERFRELFVGQTIWNVSSTAVGGGVAEMLQTLVGYVQDLDVDIRWRTISGDDEFFALTKRVHNWVHGYPGDGGVLGAGEAAHYREVLAASATELSTEVKAGDIVLLHDPQTAGLAATLAQGGAHVVWRCHIGADHGNRYTDGAWQFLRPHISPAHAFVFSRWQYVPAWLPQRAVRIVPPSIDPFSPKNQAMDDATVRAILATIGVLAEVTPSEPGQFIRRDGQSGEVRRHACVIGTGRPGPADPLVVQVSRWDRLKDMAGVMRGFADHVAPATEGYLALVGPAVAGVADDPEGAATYDECVTQWRALNAATRQRVLLVTLPLDDVDENGAMVNALQRRANVIVQKSLAEGFGLTVAEGMWKGRPVVGSAVGGIQDQVVDGTGILLPDPTDLAGFGAAVRKLLDQPDLAQKLGSAAQDHVREDFVGDLHLQRYAELFHTLMSA
jgi:trehalose synthase